MAVSAQGGLMSQQDAAAQVAGAGQPAWMEPELATLTQQRFSDPEWLYERKFDGERCLAYRSADRLRLLTRNQKQVNTTYPELSAALVAQDCGDFVVDGEVVAFDGPATTFGLLQQRPRGRDPSQVSRRRVPGLDYRYALR